MKVKNVYKAEIWGVQLDSYGLDECFTHTEQQFTDKACMFEWAREQINRPDFKPFRAYYCVKRGDDWEVFSSLDFSDNK